MPTTGEYDWDGWIPYEELPASFNPEKGYIVTANNAIIDENYPYLLTLYWDDGNRSQRITEMLEEAMSKGKVTADDFARIQFDSKSLTAEKYIPLLQTLSSSDSQVQAAIERLRGWDLQERRQRTGGLVRNFLHEPGAKRAHGRHGPDLFRSNGRGRSRNGVFLETGQ